MIENNEATIRVDISEWVKKARKDPSVYLERQATEVFLRAISLGDPFCEQLHLKGGVLMGIVYQSDRQTGDIDFSINEPPDEETVNSLINTVDKNIPIASAELGYLNIVSKIQTVKTWPKDEKFIDGNSPAITLKIAYAVKDTYQAKKLEEGTCSQVLDVDISFNEPICSMQLVNCFEGDVSIKAYSLYEIIAEKYRAILQQVIRNRSRRQDVYDIDQLITKFSFDEAEMIKVLEILIIKCEAREVPVNSQLLSDPEIIKHSKKNWGSLKLEIEEPVFEECYARVNEFYKNLPWN